MYRFLLFILPLLTISCSRSHKDNSSKKTSRPSSVELAKLINSNGGRADLDEFNQINEVQIGSDFDCIEYINMADGLECMFLSCPQKVMPTKEFKRLAKFEKVTYFNILYGSLSRHGYASLPFKFPNLEHLTLWGNVESDLSLLPRMAKLKKFTSDSDHFITVEEARRIAMSENLVDINIDNAESKEVYDILIKLPKIKDLYVGVYQKDGSFEKYYNE